MKTMGNKKDIVGKSVKSGITFGSALAMVISYQLAFDWLGNRSRINELGVCYLLYN